MSDDTSAEVPVLYHHTRRTKWGAAILASETPTSRDYQFQDGRRRTFKEGFYALLEPYECSEDEAERITHELQQQLDRHETRARIVERARREGRTVYTVSDQIAFFKQRFPQGFADEVYLTDVRGQGDAGRKKRNRDLSVSVAQELLAADRVAERVAEGDHEGLLNAFIEVLNSTDICSPSTDSRPLRKIEGEALAAFGESLQDFLYGEGAVPDRFSRFVNTLIEAGVDKPTWPMVTVPLGLLFPGEHYCIKPSVFRQQARWLAPEVDNAPTPTAAAYGGYRRMCGELNQRLRKAGLEPQDHIDTYGFIWETMRPGVREDLDKAAN